MLTRALVAASTRALILSFLATVEESYGYEIIQEVKQLSGGFIVWSDGMLYPVLHRLEEEGLIAARWGRHNGRKRRYYRLQPAGASALAEEKAQWLKVHETLVQLWQSNPHPA